MARHQRRPLRGHRDTAGPGVTPSGTVQPARPWEAGRGGLRSAVLLGRVRAAVAVAARSHPRHPPLVLPRSTAPPGLSCAKSASLTPFPVCPQDDMHRVIDRQLMDTHLKGRSGLPPPLPGPRLPRA